MLQKSTIVTMMKGSRKEKKQKKAIKQTTPKKDDCLIE